jgi:hypothetical protein
MASLLCKQSCGLRAFLLVLYVGARRALQRAQAFLKLDLDGGGTPKIASPLWRNGCAQIFYKIDGYVSIRKRVIPIAKD